MKALHIIKDDGRMTVIPLGAGKSLDLSKHTVNIVEFERLIDRVVLDGKEYKFDGTGCIIPTEA